MRTDSGALRGRRILVAASGSIAAVKTPLLVSGLVQAGAEVRCLLTPSAEQLVSPVAMATLSRHRVTGTRINGTGRSARFISNSLNGRMVVAPDATTWPLVAGSRGWSAGQHPAGL